MSRKPTDAETKTAYALVNKTPRLMDQNQIVQVSRIARALADARDEALREAARVAAQWSFEAYEHVTALIPKETDER